MIETIISKLLAILNEKDIDEIMIRVEYHPEVFKPEKIHIQKKRRETK